MTITTHLLLSLLALSLQLGGDLDDLCDDVYPDTGVPVRCAPRGDAPVLDDVVCCDAATCYASDAGACPDALEAYACELGEVLTTDEVVCYFEVPDYCEVYPCAPGYGAHPQAFGMCCHDGVCWHHVTGSNDCELGDIHWCNDGVCNEDGTVSCFD